jgi:hypothetical protein
MRMCTAAVGSAAVDLRIAAPVLWIAVIAIIRTAVTQSRAAL